MIHHEDYNCKEMGECYLSYRKRMKREHEDFIARRAIKQTNDEWSNEYETYTTIYAAGLRKREGESLGELQERFGSRQAANMGKNERR